MKTPTWLVKSVGLDVGRRAEDVEGLWFGSVGGGKCAVEGVWWRLSGGGYEVDESRA
jgi:hypothetical protein